jgi:hypothetical protein
MIYSLRAGIEKQLQHLHAGAKGRLGRIQIPVPGEGNLSRNNAAKRES